MVRKHLIKKNCIINVLEHILWYLNFFLKIMNFVPFFSNFFKSTYTQVNFYANILETLSEHLTYNEKRELENPLPIFGQTVT